MSQYRLVSTEPTTDLVRPLKSLHIGIIQLEYKIIKIFQWIKDWIQNKQITRD